MSHKIASKHSSLSSGSIHLDSESSQISNLIPSESSVDCMIKELKEVNEKLLIKSEILCRKENSLYKNEVKLVNFSKKMDYFIEKEVEKRINEEREKYQSNLNNQKLKLNEFTKENDRMRLSLNQITAYNDKLKHSNYSFLQELSKYKQLNNKIRKSSEKPKLFRESSTQTEKNSIKPEKLTEDKHKVMVTLPDAQLLRLLRQSWSVPVKSSLNNMLHHTTTHSSVVNNNVNIGNISDSIDLCFAMLPQMIDWLKSLLPLVKSLSKLQWQSLADILQVVYWSILYIDMSGADLRGSVISKQLCKLSESIYTTLVMRSNTGDSSNEVYRDNQNIYYLALLICCRSINRMDYLKQCLNQLYSLLSDHSKAQCDSATNHLFGLLFHAPLLYRNWLLSKSQTNKQSCKSINCISTMLRIIHLSCTMSAVNIDNQLIYGLPESGFDQLAILLLLQMTHTVSHTAVAHKSQHPMTCLIECIVCCFNQPISSSTIGGDDPQLSIGQQHGNEQSDVLLCCTQLLSSLAARPAILHKIKALGLVALLNNTALHIQSRRPGTPTVTHQFKEFIKLLNI